MADAELAPAFSPNSVFNFPETIQNDSDWQLAIVAELGAIVTNEALTLDARELAILELHEKTGCGTLEFRMLHMFALHAVQLARYDAAHCRSGE